MRIHKPFWTSVCAFSLVVSLLAQEIRYPEPLDFQDEAVPETYTQSVWQLESDGQSVFVRTENAYILQIDLAGQLLGVYPIPEEGSRRAREIATFALHNDQMALVNKQRRIYVVKEQQVLTSFRTQDFEFDDFYPVANAMGFGFDGDQLVLPSQADHTVAVVLGADGKQLNKAGKAVAFPEDLKWDASFLNATFWTSQGDRWYCLFKFKPLLRVYDQNFKLLKEHDLASQEIFNCDQLLYDPPSDIRKKIRIPIPHFSDFKVRGEYAYVMCRGALLAVHLETGSIKNTYHFHGRGKNFENTDDQQRLNFMQVALLDDGHAVLAHPALLWNHDLWVVKL